MKVCAGVQDKRDAMAEDNLDIDTDDDIPPWERSKPAEPEVGTSPLARQLEQDGTLDRLALRQQIDRRGEEDKAHRNSSKALLGDWDSLDENGKADWIKGRRAFANVS